MAHDFNCNEQLHDLHSSQHIKENVFKNKKIICVTVECVVILIIMRWAWHVARTGTRKVAYRALVGKVEVSTPFGRTRFSWEDNIKVNFPYVGWRDMDFTDLDQDRSR